MADWGVSGDLPIRFATRSGELLRPAGREWIWLDFRALSWRPSSWTLPMGRLLAASRCKPWRPAPSSRPELASEEEVRALTPIFTPAGAAGPIMVTAPSSREETTSSPAISPLGRGGRGSGDRLQPLRPGALLEPSAQQDGN